MSHFQNYPGQVLKSLVLEPLELSVTDAADRLGMSRVALSRVLNGKAGISPALALKLEHAGANTASFWVTMQASYDLWKVRREGVPDVEPFATSGGTRLA